MRKIFILLSLFLLFSCGASKDVVYFQDAPQGTEIKANYRPITFRPGDKLTIIVNTRNPNIANKLNLVTMSRQMGSASQTSGNNGVMSYTIDKDGNIEMPEVGTIHIAGLTRSQVAERVEQKLVEKNLVQDAVVIVEFTNLSYSILGEVKSPNRYHIDRDEITILDAISQAGDLTIQGQRANIKVLRKEDNGTQKVYTANLCSLEELQNSPVYYIQQNDIVYVEPNDMRARQSTVNGNNLRSSAFWISLASLLTSVVSIITR
ncbi:MAG: polysaccharide biosynthesis/export family protein [Bacteroidaceae bacterium]|nr:polysaccharide biosynthesis/export family protein [Bacteroidaceae bacterium]